MILACPESNSLRMTVKSLLSGFKDGFTKFEDFPLTVVSAPVRKQQLAVNLFWVT